MSPSFFQILGISRQSMLTQLLDLDVTSNNLSNIHTSGFKQSRTNFQELLQEAAKEGAYTPTTQPLTRQGAIRPTNSQLDLAISGEGFFGIETADGEVAYTRDGQFLLDGENRLVNAAGLPVVWDGEMPEGVTEVEVRQNGDVYARQGKGNWELAGTIELYRFANPSALQATPGNLFVESPNSGEAQAGQPGTEQIGIIQNHALEQSNVNLSEQMTHMISLQREFQITTRVFQQTDQMISQAINMRRA